MREKGKIKKVMIVNGWSDMNRGDSAILLGMIWLIRKYFPNCPISVMSEFDKDDPNFESSYWVVKRYFPDVQVLPALFPYPRGKGKAHKMINSVFTFLISSIVLAFPAMGHYLFRGAKSDTWSEVVDSDVLLSKGGHIFYLTSCSLQMLYSFFKHAFPLLLGARLGKKTVLYAQSFGPFRGKFCKFIAKWFFDRLTAISVREGVSRDIVQSLDVRQPVRFVPDAAFVLRGYDDEEGKLIWSNRPVILTPRQWAFKDKKTYEDYIRGLASIVEWLSENGYEVLIVSHTLGPTSAENDRIAARFLFDVLKSKKNVRIFDTEGMTTYDVIRLYASSRLLIGTRFHSVIFALLSGTPAIAISYFGPKTYGIMKDLGLDHLVFDLGRLDVERLKSTVRELLENEAQIKKEIRHRVEKIQKEAEDAGFALLKSVFTED